MQDDLVIIPTYDRPEMLWLCLEHIADSPDGRDVQIRVYVDAHYGQPNPPVAEIQAVVEKFPQLHLQTIYRQPHMYHGNSFNVLSAYREAFQSTFRYVFMIEDDILIQPEFFAWHREQHGAVDIDCSVGVKRGPEHAHYASLGVGFRRVVIAKVLPHCTPTYFNNMRLYCRTQFMPSKIDCEQDGLWCRVLDPNKIVWPVIPVAQHVGWYGYHRKKSVRPQGTLVERYQQVRRVLSSPAVLRDWQKEFGDVVPVLDWCN